MTTEVITKTNTKSNRLLKTFSGTAAIPKKITQTIKDPSNFYDKGARILAHFIYNIKYAGFENIPETGPAILIANHVSYVDGLIIHTACERRVRFIIDEYIYRIPPIKHFMDMAGAIPILPKKDSVKAALEEVSKGLRKGDLICIFPEGSMTYTGNMTRFRYGIEWMLKNDQVPVIPIAIRGLWGSTFSRKYRKSLLRFIPLTFRRKVELICGKPIPPEKATVGYMQRVVMQLYNGITPDYYNDPKAAAN